MSGYKLAVTTVTFALGAYLLYQRGQGNHDQPHKVLLPSEGTSVHCRGKTTSERFCHFHNMCYSHSLDEFIFVHGPQSEIVAVPDQRYQPELVLLTCSYDNHFNFHYIDVTPGYLSESGLPLKTNYKYGKHFMYSRVTAGNIMHVFHDELLPLFFTFLSHSELQDTSNMRLVLNDKASSMAHPFPFLYGMFTDDEPVYISELDITEIGTDLACFEDLYVGLGCESMWHQFGFITPEGPIPNATVTGNHIKLFTAHLKDHLDIHPDCFTDDDFGVLLVRKKNRFILNGGKLAARITEVFQIRMIEMSLENNTLQEIISKISCAKIAVGVHGAILILTMFLPKSSILLEIFPYAINPDHRRHYRTLVELEGMGIEYVPWRNMDRSKSLPHPNNHKLHGGIRHLSEEERNKIWNITEVPHHKNSNDPEWRFYLYQDTVVNIDAVIDLLKNTKVWRHRHLP